MIIVRPDVAINMFQAGYDVYYRLDLCVLWNQVNIYDDDLPIDVKSENDKAIQSMYKAAIECENNTVVFKVDEDDLIQYYGIPEEYDIYEQDTIYDFQNKCIYPEGYEAYEKGTPILCKNFNNEWFFIFKNKEYYRTLEDAIKQENIRDMYIINEYDEDEW